MFDPQNSLTFKAIKILKIFQAPFWKFLKTISIIAFVLFVLLFLVFIFFLPKFFPQIKLPFKFPLNQDQLLAGILISFFGFGFSFLILMFLNQKIKKMGKDLEEKEPSVEENIVDFLDPEAAKILKKSLSQKYLPILPTLLSNILKGNRTLFVFNRLLFPKKEFERELLKYRKTQRVARIPEERSLIEEENIHLAEEVLMEAARIAIKYKRKKISIFSILPVLASKEKFFKKTLDEMKILKEDVEEAAMWFEGIELQIEKKKRFWERENLYYKLLYSLVKDFIGGYTITLDEFSRDISCFNPILHTQVILHQKEIQDLEEVLAKETDNCALLVGEPGSGRKSIVYNLSYKILQQKSLPKLNFMRLLELDMASLIGQSRDLRTLEVNLKTIFNEAINAGNVILIIPEIHNYIGEKFGAEAVAKIDISGILTEYLPYPEFRLIGITTYDGFHKNIGSVREVMAHLTKIEVKPATLLETLKILEEEILFKERRTGVFVPLITLNEIIKLCDFFLAEPAFPLKAIQLLDEMVTFEKTRSIKLKGLLLPEEVDVYFSQKYEVPAGVAEEKERETLLNLETIIHEKLINQEEAVAELANALRRARAEIKKRKRTIGNFLFLGPTGVGKTETAKQLARAYFGSEKNMIRLNMAEYQLLESIDKLIGTLDTPGYLTTQVRENPFSLLLIDEIEKAHPNILNLFLSVFDEGTMTDGAGRDVDFRHTIIICTSNAGAEYIREAVERGSKLTNIKDIFIDNLLRKGIFRPEFINRFDAVVLYRPLNKEEMKEVARLMLEEIKEGLKEKNIIFLITPQLIEKLAEAGFDPAFGGRAMRRAVQNNVENNIARVLLAGVIKEGDKIEIDPETWQVKIIAKKEVPFSEKSPKKF